MTAASSDRKPSNHHGSSHRKLGLITAVESPRRSLGRSLHAHERPPRKGHAQRHRVKVTWIRFQTRLPHRLPAIPIALELLSQEYMGCVLPDCSSAHQTVLNLNGGALPRSGIERRTTHALAARSSLDTSISWIRSEIDITGNTAASTRAT